MRASCLLVLTVFFMGSVFFGCGGEQQHTEESQIDKVPKPMSEAVVHQVTIEETGKQAVDVVCEMDVEVIEATPAASYKGDTYYFCSEYCRDEFVKEPGKYLASHEHSDDTTSHH